MDVSLESGRDRFVKGHEAALAEFCAANDQAVRSEISNAECQSLRDTQPRRSKQREQGLVGMGTQGAVRRPPCRVLNKPCNLHRREDEGSRAPPKLAPEDASRRHLMPRILCAGITGKARNVAQSPLP